MRERCYSLLEQAVIYLSGSEVEDNSVYAVFLEPLWKKHYFGEEKGTIDYRKNMGFYGGFSSSMTSEHVTAYISFLLKGLEEYSQLVRKNGETNSFYAKPEFDLAQAREMMERASEDSFRETRASYGLVREKIKREREEKRKENQMF